MPNVIDYTAGRNRCRLHQHCPHDDDQRHHVDAIAAAGYQHQLFLARVLAQRLLHRSRVVRGRLRRHGAGWRPGYGLGHGTFTTAAAPGDCPAGPAPTIVASEDFEGAATGWVQEAGGTGTNTWAITSNFPFAGTKALQGLTPATASDQRFISPAFDLPTVGNGLTLSFQSRQLMESRTGGGCWDGGFIRSFGRWRGVLADHDRLVDGSYDGALQVVIQPRRSTPGAVIRRPI